MKVKGPTFKKNFKAPHLFFEDLEEIEEIFKQSLNPESYSVETNDYEYDNIHEAKRDKSTESLQFSSCSPNIYVSLTAYDASVYTYDESLTAIGAAEKISEVIQKRERKIYWLLFEKYLSVGWPLGIPLFIIFQQNNLILLTPYIILLSLLFVSIAGRLTNLYKVSKIELKSKKENINFFERNKDQIAVGLITFILGTFFTFIVEYYLRLNTK